MRGREELIYGIPDSSPVNQSKARKAFWLISGPIKKLISYFNNLGISLYKKKTFYI